MLRKNAPTFALVAAIFILLALSFRPRADRAVPDAPFTPPATTVAPPPLARSDSKAESSGSKAPSSLPPLEIFHEADPLNSPATNLAADLRLVLGVLATFRSNFPRDGNPSGSNAEITAVLTGQNKLRLALIRPDHPAINQSGELCDRWGTPFFFHAESGTRMTVQSAGPDKKLHTADDVGLSP